MSSQSCAFVNVSTEMITGDKFVARCLGWNANSSLNP